MYLCHIIKKRNAKASMFVLTKEELQYLRSNISSTNISSKSRTLPKVFTDKGLYVLATILKSDRATAVSLEQIEKFKKMRWI